MLKKLEQARDKVKSENLSNNKFSIGWVIGRGVLLAVGLVAALLMIKKRKKKFN